MPWEAEVRLALEGAFCRAFWGYSSRRLGLALYSLVSPRTEGCFRELPFFPLTNGIKNDLVS